MGGALRRPFGAHGRGLRRTLAQRVGVELLPHAVVAGDIAVDLRAFPRAPGHLPHPGGIRSELPPRRTSLAVVAALPHLATIGTWAIRRAGRQHAGLRAFAPRRA